MYTLKRILHYIINLRKLNPSSKIFISKFDFDAAYRRCHLSATTSAECCTIHENYLYMHLRLTFGGSACPTLWNALAEPITDIANKLIQNPLWNHSEVFDPLMNLLGEPLSLNNQIPITKAKELSVSIPTNNIGKIDLYLDDNIAIALGENDNISRVSNALITAVHAVTRPLDDNDQIPR
jgi:hypothetical protein